MTTTALLVIDVQEEYFSGALPIEHPPRGASLAAIGRAMDAATAAGTPVVVVRQNGSPDGTFEPGSAAWALRPEVSAHAHDLLLDKEWPGSFTGTELQAWLAERGVDHVVIAGYMTNICCDTTARQALHLELGVTVLADAQGTPSMPGPDGEDIPAVTLHTATLATLEFLGADLATTDEWIASLS